MKNPDYFKDKRVTVVGLGRSGLACARLLGELGAQVFLTDNQDTPGLRSSIAQLKSDRIKAELGRHSPEAIKGRDLVILSPGVPSNALPVRWAEESGVPIISEIEFAWMLCPAKIIAVTGSNGKTTVTTLIGKILEKTGRKVFVCGNIGNPFAGEVAKIGQGDFVSLEVSSFQLERIKDFKPKISLILNFARNHLDRHRDLNEYLEAKKRIFMNQDKDDYLVLNYQDPVLKGISREAKARVEYFSRAEGINPNQAAVLAVASILKIDKGLAMDVFKEFRGIEHRMEEVGQINRIRFINDSKATTADSTLWALENISQPVFLIAGGRDKGVDYSIILDLLRRKAKGLILIGEASKKISAALKGFPFIEEALDLAGAVRKAYAKAEPGDCILLSPMCSSFDMFSNYEERGEIFKKAVSDLSGQRLR